MHFKAIDVSTGDTKVDTMCSRWALDNFKQYVMMWHILPKLEYLFSKSSMMQGKWKRLRGFSFVREDHCLNAERHWAVVLHPILEIRGHSTTSQHWLCHRDLTLATITISAGLSEDMRHDTSVWFLLGAFTHPVCHTNWSPPRGGGYPV